MMWPMQYGVVRLSFDDGTPDKYYWWASDDPHMDEEKALALAKRNGPFDTEEAAVRAMQRRVLH
jgi:hypothetical protein